MTRNQSILGLIILFSFLGASTGVAVKLGVQDISPISFVALRVILSLILILPFIIKSKLWQLKNKFKLFSFSLLAVANITLFSLGIGQTSIAIAAILYTLVPLITALLSRLLYQEKLSSFKTIGIILGFIGTSLVILTPAFSQGSLQIDGLLGSLTILTAVCFFSLHTVLSQKILQHFSPFTIIQAFIITATLVLLPLADWEIQNKTLWLVQFNFKSISALLYVSAIGTISSYFLYQHIIKRASPLLASLTMYLQPIFAIILGILIFNEQLALEFILGASLTLLGVWLVTSQQKKGTIVQEANITP